MSIMSFSATLMPRKKHLPKPAHGLSEDQQHAVTTILSEKGPFFLTGTAGSGKSFVIDHLRSIVPKCKVTAMTGSAAQLIKGKTLHSFCSIHPTYGVVASKAANRRIRDTELLIIDEISMADPELLWNVFERFDQADHAPKLLIVGDFMQLPPVEGKCLFEDKIWELFKVLKLTKQHRQSDDKFISILNDIRVGKLTEEVKEFIKSRTVEELPDDCTHLMAKRDMVQMRNEAKLKMLDGQSGRSIWEVKWSYEYQKNEKLRQKIDLSKSRFPEVLRLKEGARVVLLTNSDQWVNGSTGIVEAITPGIVRVKLDEGRIVSVAKEIDEITDENDNTICQITQYPILLAWGLTIHRAQGATIDRVGVDLRGHFDPGQTYVALSRCKTAEGLFLKGSLPELKVNPDALKHS